MELKVLTMFSDIDGEARCVEDAVEFRSNDHGLSLTAALISPSESCRNFQYVELPVGFQSSGRIADIGQLAVCLAGKVEITGASGEGYVLGAGGVFRLRKGKVSSHTIAVSGEAPVHLLVIQL